MRTRQRRKVGGQVRSNGCRLCRGVGTARYRLDGMLVERARVAGLYRELLGDVKGLMLPCNDLDEAKRGWFVFVV